MTVPGGTGHGGVPTDTVARRCEVRPDRIGMAVFAIEPIGAGEWAIELPSVFDSQPGSHTIQIDERRHQAYTGDVDDFINHACDPSAYLDVRNLRVVARRPLGPGDEITINYAASEWEMLQPFVCECDGVPRPIRGFRHLSSTERQQIAHLVPAWLWGRCAQSEETQRRHTMGTEEKRAQGENVDEEVEDLEATEAEEVSGGISEVSGLKFEVTSSR